MNQNPMLKPALIGGVLLGILSAVPPVNLLNCACCAWVIGGGVLAANLYVKSSPVMVTLGTGCLLGMLTGAIGAVVSTLFSIPIQILMSNVLAGYAEEMRQRLASLPTLPPAWRDFLSSMPVSGGFNFITVLLNGFLSLIVYSLMAMLGGMLGVALFEKRKPEPPAPAYRPPVDLPPPPPPVMPPPPPPAAGPGA
jgi:hypothetical protein